MREGSERKDWRDTVKSSLLRATHHYIRMAECPLSKFTAQLNGKFNLLESYDKHPHSFFLQRNDYTS